MLYLIKEHTDELLKLINEDPIRPGIPNSQRIGKNKDIFISHDDNGVHAVTCVSYQKNIPKDESELFENLDQPNVAIFYTIWSYQPGSGRQLLLDSVKYIQENNKYIERFVTLSPKTEMARKFHLKNGASIFRENAETINYEYRTLAQR